MQSQIRVGEASGLRGTGKPSLRVEIAVGVDVDDERLTAGVDAHVDATVVAALERFEGSYGHFDAALLDVARQ